MIRLFSGRRKAQFLLLFAVAAGELGATLLVVAWVHRITDPGAPLLVGLAALGAFVLQVVQRRLCDGVGLSYSAEVRSTLFRHLMRADPQVVRRRRHGAVLQSFVGDLTALRQWVSDGLVRGALALFAGTGMLLWVMATDRRLATVLAAIALTLAVAGAGLVPLLARAVKSVRRERGRVAAFASERLAAQASVQLFGRARSEEARLNRRVERLNRAALQRAWITGAMRALPHLATTAMLAAVVLVNGSGAGSGLASGVVIVGILGFAMRDLVRACELMIPGRIAMARIAGLLQLPRPRKAGKSVRNGNPDGQLALDRLRVAEGGPRFSASAPKGSVVLLAGPADMVRDVLAAVAGSMAPVSGTVRWDGIDLTAVSPAKRCELVGAMMPDLPLVSGSAALNIRYRQPKIAPAEIARLAGLWDLNPEDRRADPTRLAIVRALTGTPPVLVLDLSSAQLADGQAQLLRSTLAEWPGVVLLATQQERLHSCATRVWQLDDTGLSEAAAVRSEALRVIDGSRAERQG